MQDFYRAGRVLNFAHRGARTQAPENTIPAFQLALEQGADGVELDVQMTFDKKAVIMHNPSVDETTDGEGGISGLEYAEVRALDAGIKFGEEWAGTKVPTLDEVFETLGRDLLFNVEIKQLRFSSDGAEQAVFDAIEKHDLFGRVIVSSFNPFTLRRFKKIAKDRVPVGRLWVPEQPWLFRSGILMLGVGYEADHPELPSASADYVARQHDKGRRVNVWTVNERDDMESMIAAGVDSIITDFPDVLSDVLNGMKAAESDQA